MTIEYAYFIGSLKVTNVSVQYPMGFIGYHNTFYSEFNSSLETVLNYYNRMLNL